MKIYICDGTPDCFYTAVYDAFGEKDSLITSDDEVQLSLDCRIVRVVSDGEKAGRARRAVERYDKEAVNAVELVLRSCEALKEQTALEYIRRLAERKAPISKMLHLPEVIEFNDLMQKVTGEAHRFKGFLRFMESAGGALYAPYSPDNDITDLLMPHFSARLSGERFVIHDLKRKIAGMYDGREWIMGYTGEAEIYLSEYERAFETLWKKYYRAVNIEERPHEKQMRGYMPARYWKFLPEKNGNG